MEEKEFMANEQIIISLEDNFIDIYIYCTPSIISWISYAKISPIFMMIK